MSATFGELLKQAYKLLSEPTEEAPDSLIFTDNATFHTFVNKALATDAWTIDADGFISADTAKDLEEALAATVKTQSPPSISPQQYGADSEQWVQGYHEWKGNTEQPESKECRKHSWKTYKGFTETYDYCEHCDAKSPREWV